MSVNLSQVSHSQASEYHFAHDAEQQHLDAEWQGRGAHIFGHKPGDPVTRDDFSVALAGLNPKTGEQMVPDGGNGEHRAGYGLILSPPKDFSVYSLVVDDTGAGTETFKTAVRSTLEHVQDYAQGRVSIDGQKERTDTGNLAIATFYHSDSRPVDGQPGDPQLHAHNIVMNATQRQEDGKVVAVEPRAIYEAQKDIGRIFNAELASEYRKLGLSVTADEKGVPRIEGMPKEVTEAFSKRTNQVEGKLQELRAEGFADSPEVKHLANLASKSSKGHFAELQQLHAWEQQLTDAGTNRQELQASIKSAGTGKEHAPEIPAKDYVRMSALSHTEEKPTFSKKEVLSTALKLSGTEHTMSDLKGAFHEMTKSKEMVATGQGQFITRDQQKLDRETMREIDKGKGTVETMFTPMDAKMEILKWEQRFSQLTNDQRQAVFQVLISRDQYPTVRGSGSPDFTAKITTIVNSIAHNRGKEAALPSPSISQANAAIVSGHIREAASQGIVLGKDGPSDAKFARSLFKQVVNELPTFEERKAVRLLVHPDGPRTPVKAALESGLPLNQVLATEKMVMEQFSRKYETALNERHDRKTIKDQEAARNRTFPAPEREHRTAIRDVIPLDKNGQLQGQSAPRQGLVGQPGVSLSSSLRIRDVIGSSSYHKNLHVTGSLTGKLTEKSRHAIGYSHAEKETVSHKETGFRRDTARVGYGGYQREQQTTVDAQTGRQRTVSSTNQRTDTGYSAKTQTLKETREDGTTVTRNVKSSSMKYGSGFRTDSVSKGSDGTTIKSTRTVDGGHFREKKTITTADGTRKEIKSSGGQEKLGGITLWGSKTQTIKETDKAGNVTKSKSTTNTFLGFVWGKTLTQLPDGRTIETKWKGVETVNLWGEKKVKITSKETREVEAKGLVKSLASLFIKEEPKSLTDHIQKAEQRGRLYELGRVPEKVRETLGYETSKMPRGKDYRIVGIAKEYAGTPKDETAQVLTYSKSRASELNGAIREELKLKGHLGRSISVDTYHVQGGSIEKGQMEIAAGERIKFGKYDKNLGVSSGQTGTVTHVDRDGAITVALDRMESAGTRKAPSEVTFITKEYASLSYAYADTTSRQANIGKLIVEARTDRPDKDFYSRVQGAIERSDRVAFYTDSRDALYKQAKEHDTLRPAYDKALQAEKEKSGVLGTRVDVATPHGKGVVHLQGVVRDYDSEKHTAAVEYQRTPGARKTVGTFPAESISVLNGGREGAKLELPASTVRENPQFKDSELYGKKEPQPVKEQKPDVAMAVLQTIDKEAGKATGEVLHGVKEQVLLDVTVTFAESRELTPEQTKKSLADMDKRQAGFLPDLGGKLVDLVKDAADKGMRAIVDVARNDVAGRNGIELKRPEREVDFTSPALTRELAKEQVKDMDHHREEQRQHEQAGKMEAKKWDKEMEM